MWPGHHWDAVMKEGNCAVCKSWQGREFKHSDISVSFHLNCCTCEFPLGEEERWDWTLHLQTENLAALGPGHSRMPQTTFLPIFFNDTEKAQMGKNSPSSFLNTGSSSFQDLHSVFFTYEMQTRREPSLSVQKSSPDKNPNCWHLRLCSQAGHIF